MFVVLCYVILFYFASFAICSLRPPTKLSRIFLISANINQPSHFIVCVTFISCVPLMWCAVLLCYARTLSHTRTVEKSVELYRIVNQPMAMLCIFTECLFFFAHSAARINSLQLNENGAILCTPCRRIGYN